jgi:hypothetical protein
VNDPFRWQPSSLALVRLHVGVHGPSRCRCRITSRLPGTPESTCVLVADLRDLDSAITFAGDTHNEFKGLVTLVDELVYGLVPEHALA